MGVTKLYRLVENLPKGKTFSVKGFQSARLTVNITEITGTLTFGIYGDAVDASSNTVTSRPPVYLDGVLQTNNIALTKVGKYEILIDLADVGSLRIVKVMDNVTDSSVLSCSYDAFVAPVVEKAVVPDNYIAGGGKKTIAVPQGARQVDINIESVTSPTSTKAMYFYIKGSTDGNEFTNLHFYNESTANVVQSGYVAVTNGERFTLRAWLNVEDYKFLQLHYYGGNADEYFIADVLFSDIYKERILLVIAGTANIGFNFLRNSLLRGYKAAHLKIDAEISDSNAVLHAFPLSAVNESSSRLDKRLYTIYGNEVSTDNAKRIYFGATMSGGEIIVVADGNPQAWYFNGENMTGTINVVATMMAEPRFLDLPVVGETNDYVVKEQPTTTANRDVYNNSVVEWDNSSLTFYPYGYGCFSHKVTMDTSVCPTWMQGEQILFVYLLPYNGGSATVNGRGIPSICVFTNKGRILHNNPVRYSGGAVMSAYKSDMMLFAESLVVENANSLKWLPSNDKNAAAPYKFFPVLTDYDYNQFNGRLTEWGRTENVNTQLTFPSNVLYHQKNKNYGQWRKLNFGNMAKDDKVCIFVNYNGNNIGQEPVMIATNDGGRRWDVLPKFACVEHYADMYAGNVDFSKIGSYTANSLKLCRCAFNVPTAENKEPETAFVIPQEQQSLITSISVSGGVTTITTAEDLTFDNAKSPRVFLANVSATGDWEYVCNNDPMKGNNGIFFRAVRTAANTYTLKADLGDAYQSDRICRHFHNIARTSNGYMICTGESYAEGEFQGGFLYFLAQNKRDGFATVATSYGDVISPASITRLTSSKDGVVRASG
ncbi:MAG: hypothetical protein J6Q73_10190, partial [Bacteroidaceae bacterium]|nr:hypothetical protein [Bacteroidaceae bacterium]